MKGQYTDLADEYYDEGLHPTCKAFRDASYLALGAWREVVRGSRVCEVGSGRSLLAERFGSLARSLVLVDSSRKMLDHSRPFWGRSVLPVCAAAERLPVPSECCDGVVSILGDPYNTIEFWREVHRVVIPGGFAIYTTPAYDWARDFRGAALEAEFKLRNGSSLLVPSLVFPANGQRGMIEAMGFEVVAVRSIHLGDLQRAGYAVDKAHKLSRDSNPSGEVVTGYLGRRRG